MVGGPPCFSTPLRFGHRFDSTAAAAAMARAILFSLPRCVTSSHITALYLRMIRNLQPVPVV
jgi:hypothetical protein